MNLHYARNPGLTTQNNQHKTSVGHRKTEMFKTDAVILACPNSCVLEAISVFYLTTAVYYMGLLHYLNIGQKLIGK